jgi:hypothetical protein
LIATTTSSINANSVHYLEFDVTIGSSASYNIYLDGVSILSGTGNTKGTSLNNYVNQFAFQGGNSGGFIFDDLYIFNTSGLTNNSVLLTNPRIETQFPISDNQRQFSNNGNVLGEVYSYPPPGYYPTIGANTMVFRKFTPVVNMTINSISFVPNVTSVARVKAFLYTDNSGVPGTLITSGSEISGSFSGVTTSILSSSENLIAATPYWLGFITDVGFQCVVADLNIQGYTASYTYGSIPSTAPTVTSGQPSWQIWGNCNGITQNWVVTSNNPPLDNFGYISSNTPGNEDLYNFPNLSTHPTAIYTVSVKGYLKLSDTGNRSVDLRMKSSSTDSAGSNAGQIPGTAFGWFESFFDTDPATGIAWTESGINNAISGVKVAT